MATVTFESKPNRATVDGAAVGGAGLVVIQAAPGETIRITTSADDRDIERARLHLNFYLLRIMFWMVGEGLRKKWAEISGRPFHLSKFRG